MQDLLKPVLLSFNSLFIGKIIFLCVSASAHRDRHVTESEYDTTAVGGNWDRPNTSFVSSPIKVTPRDTGHVWSLLVAGDRRAPGPRLRPPCARRGPRAPPRPRCSPGAETRPSAAPCRPRPPDRGPRSCPPAPPRHTRSRAWRAAPPSCTRRPPSCGPGEL